VIRTTQRQFKDFIKKKKKKKNKGNLNTYDGIDEYCYFFFFFFFFKTEEAPPPASCYRVLHAVKLILLVQIILLIIYNINPKN
jgi:hypothetical protein